MAHTPKTTVAVWPWPVSRLARGRILAFCGVFLLTVLVLCSVSLTVNTALLLEKRDPFKALFQPGDMVPIRLDEKSGPSSKVNTAIGPNQLTIAAMDQQPAQPTVLPELSSALFGSESTLSPPLNLSVGSPGTRLDDATETEASQSPSEVLLTLLKDALAKAINISASVTETSTQAQTLFRFTGSLAPATPFAATSSSQSFPLSQPNTLVSYGSGPRLAKRSGQPDLGAEIFPILSPVSGVVAHFAVVDVNATAKLVSSVLSALSIGTSTVDKVLLEVASQTSTKLEQVLPLVIPAVSSLLDQHIDDSPLRDDINATAVCQDVVQNGIAIINQIARTTTYPMDARLQAVTDSIDMQVPESRTS
ncbi:hypothetical protein VFPBJ_08779 [Purpureocillium lilacinum]|uniref:Uncharacterized protein n=1 Tax=Purpureocillium lilacinum TaxID=33203 RepID=A0A179GH11_PURLI|nr:hypothetical protein VFPBJ_08779 [Purpureocillium lilacinum]